VGSRAISFGGYDPLGRERSRTETKNGASPGTTTTFTYDPLGQLSHAVQTTATATLFDQSFTYDALGNIHTLSDAAASGGPSTTTLSYLGADHDRDRICHIAYGSDSNTDCNVSYDEIGNIVSQQTSTGIRQYSYYIDGSVRSISDDKGSAAQFRYDALGEVQELDLTSNVSTDTRHDWHYGDLIAWRDVTTGGSTTSVLSRKIPGPHGFSATRRGAGGLWIFEFGEARGNRFFTDANGAFVQDVDYQPFGTATSTGAQPGSNLYSNEQWNSGDALAAFGISKLGARLYDPAIGRFLSRDPLLATQTATKTNPYAFAGNDPVNGSDPSGLFTVFDITNGLAESGGGGGGSHDAYGFDDHFNDDTYITLTIGGSPGSGGRPGSGGVGSSSPPTGSRRSNNLLFDFGFPGGPEVAAPTASALNEALAAASAATSAAAATAEAIAAAVGLVVVPIAIGGTLTLTIPGAGDALGCAEDPTICIARDIEDDQRRLRDRPRVNLDTSAIIAASSMRNQVLAAALRAYLANVNMVVTEAALQEFLGGSLKSAGPIESFRAMELLSRAIRVPNNPSARVLNLPQDSKKRRRYMGSVDRQVFGTADTMGLRTMTSDLKFPQYANSHGVLIYIIPIPTNNYLGE
jgi:RHS repeat-associated protein